MPLASDLMRKPQSGDRVEPGAASAPGFARSKQTKSPLGATEIGRPSQLLPLIRFHSRLGGGDTVTDSTRSPRWGFLSVFVAFHPGAEAAPGSTRSPLCGLGLAERERIDHAMCHSVKVESFPALAIISRK